MEGVCRGVYDARGLITSAVSSLLSAELCLSEVEQK